MTTRRTFVTLLGGAAAMWPIVTWVQQRERAPRIGVLIGTAADDARAGAHGRIPAGIGQFSMARTRWRRFSSIGQSDNQCHLLNVLSHARRDGRAARRVVHHLPEAFRKANSRARRKLNRTARSPAASRSKQTQHCLPRSSGQRRPCGRPRRR